MFLYPRSDLPCTGAFTAPAQTDREFHHVDKTYASTAVRKALARDILARDDANLINEFVTELQAIGKDVLENPEFVRRLLNELIEEKKRKGEL